MTSQMLRCPLTSKRGRPIKAQAAATISNAAFDRPKSVLDFSLFSISSNQVGETSGNNANRFDDISVWLMRSTTLCRGVLAVLING